MVQRLGDEGAMRLLRIHDGIIREALARHEGLEVKHTGDGIMASFASVQAALACAVAIQQGFAAHNASHPGASAQGPHRDERRRAGRRER